MDLLSVRKPLPPEPWAVSFPLSMCLVIQYREGFQEKESKRSRCSGVAGDFLHTPDRACWLTEPRSSRARGPGNPPRSTRSGRRPSSSCEASGSMTGLFTRIWCRAQPHLHGTQVRELPRRFPTEDLLAKHREAHVPGTSDESGARRRPGPAPHRASPTPDRRRFSSRRSNTAGTCASFPRFPPTAGSFFISSSLKDSRIGRWLCACSRKEPSSHASTAAVSSAVCLPHGGGPTPPRCRVSVRR